MLLAPDSPRRGTRVVAASLGCPHLIRYASKTGQPILMKDARLCSLLPVLVVCAARHFTLGIPVGRCDTGARRDDIGFVKVDLGVLVIVLRGGVEVDVGEIDLERIGGTVSGEAFVRAGDGVDGTDAVDYNISVLRDAGRSTATAVVGVEDDEVLALLYACVLIRDLFDQTAAVEVAFDANGAGIGGWVAFEVYAVDEVISKEHVGDTVKGLATDGETVSAVELVFDDGDV